jgi:hypothetical protein
MGEEKIGGRPGYNRKARADKTIRRVVGIHDSYVDLCDGTQIVWSWLALVV